MSYAIQAGSRQVGLLCGRCEEPFRVGDQTRLVACTPHDGAAACVEVHVVCKSVVTRNGQVVTNQSDAERLVTLRHGERRMRLLLAAGESRSCGDMPEEAELTSSSDTSTARGSLKLEGGTRTT